MNKIVSNIKKIVCLLLCFCISFSFSGCSSSKLTEKNITSTVNNVEQAFISLNISKLKKHVRFDTTNGLNSKFDIKKIQNKKQLYKLGKVIFENLDIEVESINFEEQTITLNVTNKVLYKATLDQLNSMKNGNSAFKLMQDLNDKDSLEKNIDELTKKYEPLPLYNVPKQITVKIEQAKNHLVLVLDSEALSAITGEFYDALIKAIGFGS